MVNPFTAITRIGLAGFIFAALMSTSAQAQVVALGASNTAGKGVGASQAFPVVLDGMLKASGSAMRVRNAGISGNTTGDMLARLNSAVPAGTKIVIVQYGGNDARKGAGASRQDNIAKIESTLQARGIQVIQADGLVRSAMQGGQRLPDGQHLTVEGHRQVANQLLSSVR